MFKPVPPDPGSGRRVRPRPSMTSSEVQAYLLAREALRRVSQAASSRDANRSKGVG